MRKLMGPLGLSIALGLATHFAILNYAPTFIIDRAYTMLGERGMAVHGFTLAPRMTPSTQSVVRPSPDLAYSACRYDLAQAPNGIRVTMARYDGYSSLSFFDAQTNNFRTIRGNGEAQEAVLLPPAPDSGSPEIGGPEAIRSPSQKGIILIRRLAPTSAAYAAVAEASPGDLCQAI